MIVSSLHKRQNQLLDYIKRKPAGEGVSAVHFYLTKLESMGYMKRDPTKPRYLV